MLNVLLRRLMIISSDSEFSWSDFWGASEDLVVDTAVSLFNVEGSLDSPSWSPGVGSDPIVNILSISSVSDELNGVTSEETSSNVLVGSWGVTVEVFIDWEGSFNWAVVVDFWFNLSSAGWVNNWTWGAFVLGPWWTINALGGAWCFWSVTSSVWETWVWDNTSVLEILPGVFHISTTATIVALVTADHILWWEDNVDLTSWLNGKSVWECFWGTESPAWSALLLISDGVDIAWPLGSGIEGVWDGSDWGLGVDSVCWNDVGSEHVQKLFMGIVGEWVFADFVSLPWWVGSFDWSNEVFVDWVRGSSEGNDGSDDNELEHYKILL